MLIFCMPIDIFKRNKLIGLVLVGLGLSKVLHNDKSMKYPQEVSELDFLMLIDTKRSSKYIQKSLVNVIRQVWA